MKILFINSVCGIGSTGRICTDLAQEYESKGDTVKIAYGRGVVPSKFEKYAIRIGNDLDWKFHALQTRIFDNHGFASVSATKKFLEWVEDYKPDLIWLHNIHGYYINIELLFSWIKNHPQIKINWTLHDCWAFTGHCAFFTAANCNKWKIECKDCVQKRAYPASYIFSNATENFQNKRKIFTSVPNLTIITPSQWLADLVKESFLKEYPVKVNYNTVDKSIFKPTNSDFRATYGIEGKTIILGVANIWVARKGLSDFIKLSRMLNDEYLIILVGLNKQQISRLPKNIIGIERTNSPKELAEIYSASDVFVNPTYEDNFPTVNLEAEACGTRVITYDTGGCRETLSRVDSIVVDTGDVNAIYRNIVEI